MNFCFDFSKDQSISIPAGLSDKEIMKSIGSFLKYCMENFEDEKMSAFLLTVTHLAQVARESGGVFDCNLDEESKLGHFRLSAERLSAAKGLSLGKALRFAVHNFEFDIESEGRCVLIHGTMDLS